MKNLIFFCFLFICLSSFFYSSAQGNLVPNPSFEDTLECPNDLNQVDRATGWFAADGTPDYYNSCFTSPLGIWNVDVPFNSFGYQYALGGNAYMGLATFYTGGGITVREAIGTQLTTPLQIGSRYYITFYVSLHNALQNSCAANKLGIYFSTYIYQWSNMNPVPRMNQSQIFTDSIISDTTNWVKVTGSFIADSNYSYCYIGNFFDDSLTNYTILHGSGGTAYYFLDDICVSIDSDFCNLNNTIENLSFGKTISVFPNPFSENTIIKYDIPTGVNEAKIIFFDNSGRIIQTVRINERGEGQLNVFASNLTSGIYSYSLIADGKVIATKKMVCSK